MQGTVRSGKGRLKYYLASSLYHKVVVIMVATKRVSVRLPVGLYRAVKELATEFGVGITDMAGVLLGSGIAHVKPDSISEETRALIVADAMESVAMLIRAFADMPKNERARAEAAVGDLFTKLRDLAGETPTK